MAIRDYIVCKRCECKIIYDGHDNGRERMEELWGDPSAGLWTPLLLCPTCIALLESELAACQLALAKVGPYYIPATCVGDDEAKAVYAAIDKARKGEGE